MNNADHKPFLLQRQNTIPLGTVILAGDSTIYPFLKNWIDQLLPDGGFKSKHFSEAAFYYETIYGRQALIQFIRDHQDEINYPQNELLIALHEQADLTFVDIGPFASLQQALSSSTKPFHVIASEIDLVYVENNSLPVFQLAGDVSTPLSVVLHECDLVEWEQKNLRLLRQLSEQILTNPIIWISGNPGDPLFQQWRRLLTGNSDAFSQPQIVIPPNHALLDYESLWGKDDAEFINNTTDVSVTTSRVLELMTKKKKTHRTTIDVDTLRKRPYKFLDYFSEADRYFFFGRETKIKSLYANVTNFPMLLLYGPSGVGKTSLLRAGLRPKLSDNGIKSIYLIIGLSWQDLKRDLEQIRSEKAEHPLVLILDQAEEFFTRLTDEEREAAFNEIETLLAEFKDHIHIILSFREDFLGSFLGWSQNKLPVYMEHARLTPLNSHEARQAIEKPAEKVGVKIEASVVDDILEELDNDGIMPSQLQIVCDRLYDQRDLANVIRTRHYENVGRASGVLNDYLQVALQRFRHEQQQNVQTILQALVTPEGWREQRSKHDLQEKTKLPLEEIEWLLMELVQSRLVRSMEQAGNQYFELAHDLLATNLLEWIDTGKQRALEIAQLLNITERHTGADAEISKDKLIQISAELNNPHLQLTSSQVAIGIHAALLYGIAESAWVQRGIDAGVDVWSLLEPMLSAIEADMRKHAVLGLAGVPGPRALNHLSVLMNDPSQSVRVVSHQILYQIGTPEAKKLLDASSHLRLVPAGPFTMGRPLGLWYVIKEYVIKQKINFPGPWMVMAWNESPSHTINQPAFFAGRTPVTRREYVEFIQSGGYQDQRYWTKAGWSWRVSNNREKPDLWDDEQYADPQFPVIGVTWFEAVAYARWAGGRLLTEAEWEKAGRSTDERHFPWGNVFDKSLCNTREGGVGGLTPVGKYSPQGDSPYGIADLSGNVWEWTNSIFKPYPYDPDDGREDPENGDLRIPRGGSWSWLKHNARLVCRGTDAPDYSSQNLGFRYGADAEIGGVTGEELV